jgi:flagellar assembly protein FliH
MSRVVGKADGGHCRLWDIPDLAASSPCDSGSRAAGQNLPMATGKIEELRRRAYEEGFALGREEGQAAGRQELSAGAERLELLMYALARPFEELDQEVEEKLVALSIAIARQLVRRELRTDPGQIVAVVREAVTTLPESGRSIQLYLHPEDAGLVRELLPLPEGERPWTILEDPTIDRGGCKVTTDASRVDATLDARLNAVIVAIMGGEREGDGM